MFDPQFLLDNHHKILPLPSPSLKNRNEEKKDDFLFFWHNITCLAIFSIISWYFAEISARKYLGNISARRKYHNIFGYRRYQVDIIITGQYTAATFGRHVSRCCTLRRLLYKYYYLHKINVLGLSLQLKSRSMCTVNVFNQVK